MASFTLPPRTWENTVRDSDTAQELSKPGLISAALSRLARIQAVITLTIAALATLMLEAFKLTGIYGPDRASEIYGFALDFLTYNGITVIILLALSMAITFFSDK